MVDRLMAIPRGQNHILPVRYCRDSGVVTSADKYCSLMETLKLHKGHGKRYDFVEAKRKRDKEKQLESVQPGRPLLRLPDDSFSLMQIVESVYLRNIYPKNIGKSSYPAVPGMQGGGDHIADI